MTKLLSNMKVLGGCAVAIVLATVGIMTFFVEQSDFDAYAAQVSEATVKQEAKNLRATIMLEIRFLQSQKRQAKKEKDQEEVDRLADEIKDLDRDLDDLKPTQ